MSTYSSPIYVFKYAADGISINNGNDTSGGIFHFDLTNNNGVIQDKNNGYLEVGQSSVSQWISALKGDPDYVGQHEWNTTFTDANDDLFPVSDISQIVEMSGASFAPNDPTYNHTVYATDPPSNVTVDFPSGSTVTQGQSIGMNLQEQIEAYHSNYHYEYVQIVGADGKDYTSQAGFNYEGAVSGNQTQIYAQLYHGNDTGQSVLMQEVSGGGTTSYPPSPVTTINGGGGYSSPEYINTANLPPQQYTVYFYVKDYFNRAGQVASATFTVTPATGPTISLSANPTSLQTGQSSTLTATATNAPSSSDTIKIIDQSGKNTLGGQNSYTANSSTTASTTATDNSAETVNYVAELLSPSGSVIATSGQVSVTWNAQQPSQPTGPAPSTSLTLSANPTTLTVGGTTTLTVTIPPDPNTGLVASGEFVQIYDQTTGQYVGAGATTGTYQINNGSNVGTVTYSQPYTSNTTGSQNFVAELWAPGVTPWNNPPSLTSNTQTVTWVKPTVTLTANPTNAFTGQPSQISYTTVGFSQGDYVTISGSGGQNMWNETNDTNASDSFTETENPTNGGTTTVQYTAKLCNSSGTVLSTSTLTVTWTAPTITMSANPTTNVPGQTSTISYSINMPLPSGYSVTITPSGNGADMWSASGLTGQSGSYKETESPAAGGTITANYTGAVVNNSTGQTLATGTTSVSWSNPWTGTITLTANPKYLPTGQATTLTATTSQAVPSGWSLVIMDQTTGQTVSTSGSAPETTQYASYLPETDTFVAYLSDGFENVGNPSNTVQVVWSQLSLGANPTQLPAGQSTTLTVTGQNVPNGDYLVIFNQSTGQVVGYSQSTPYSVKISEPTPQTDTFIAYISSNSSTSGALIASNTVLVDWYGVMLTASPTSLPVNDTSTLTATAQNLPTGYVIDILDQTTGQVIATGQPGQTVLSVLQTKNKVETDNYLAQVVQPGNPVIPGMTVPATSPQGILYGTDSGSPYGLGIWNLGSGSYSVSVDPYAGGLPLNFVNKIMAGKVWALSFDGVSAYDVSTGQWTNYPSPDGNVYFPEDIDTKNGYILAYGYLNNVVEINPSTGAYTNLGVPMSSPPSGFYIENLVYDPADDCIYVGAGVNGGKNATPPSSNLYEYSFATHTWNPAKGMGSPSFFGVGVMFDPANNLLLLSSYDNFSGGNDYWFLNPISGANTPITGFGGLGNNASGIAYNPTDGNIYIGTYYITPSGGLGYLWQWQWAPGSGIDTIYNSSAQSIMTYIADAGEGSFLWMNGATYPYQLYSPSTGTWSVIPNAPILNGGNNTPLNSEFTPRFYQQVSSANAVQYLPYWAMPQMPSYIPTNLFNQAASPSADGKGFWTDGNTTDPNGTAWFEATFTTGTTESVNVTIPNAPTGIETIYIDGNPVLQDGTNPAALSGVPTGLNASVSLAPGVHQVVIEGTQTNGFNNSNPSAAHVSLQITDVSGTLLANTASAWKTTGYVTQLPAGWFSGAIGTFTWTEYIMQENPSQPIYQQQSYSLTNTAANVSATSAPVSVTWYAYDLTLSANPTQLPAGQATTLTATSTTGGPAGDVIEIYDQTTGKVVGTSSANATSFTGTWTENAPTTDTFIAWYVNPQNGNQDQASNTVQVTWNQAKLTLSNAMVYHTPAWLQNLENHNTWYPDDPRPVNYFWAGEEIKFKVLANIPIQLAYVTLNLNYDQSAPAGLPWNLTIPLTYDPTDGYLEGNTDPNLTVTINNVSQPALEFLADGTYTANFWVKSTDNQVASTTAQFVISGKWVGTSPYNSYYHDDEIYTQKGS